MREICKSGSMRGCRKGAATYRACVLLYNNVAAGSCPTCTGLSEGFYATPNP